MTDLSDVLRPARRDFIWQAANVFAGVGGAAALWPFIDQMNPHKATQAPEARDVDLSSIEPGQKTVAWRGLPVTIRHRSPDEVSVARNVAMSELPDALARNEALPKNAPASDANRTKAGHEQWLVVVGLCTHLSCRLSPVRREASASGEGWFCPCHAARFDLSGRVRSGPARTNLPVPPYAFLSPMKIRIG
jgi:ubiquinol-cytochrome c reductase iron-sulfur subunit